MGTAIVVPGVAGYVAFRIHRERLAHEREMQDAVAMRAVAYDGATLLTAAVIWADSIPRTLNTS